MRVVPVIDLKRGRVVRGIAGNREQYRPLESRLTRDTSAAGVARAYAALPAVEEVYVADLDAIGGAPPNESALAQIASSGLKLWVDAGVRGASDARRLLASPAGHNISSLIVALETATGREALGDILAATGRERCVLSLDLKAGQPLTADPCWRSCSPLEIAAQAAEIGLRRLIVLDLASVGVYDGGSQLELCAALKAAHRDLEITSGGGVRSVDDLMRFAEAGASAVLVASALHDLRISPGDLAALME